MSILDAICAERREDARLARRRRPPSSLERPFGPPLRAFGKPGTLIAECKKASPSRGLMVPDYDAAGLAMAYERGGAGMVSVLTEPRRFLGSDADLSRVRSSVGLPILRKDFIVDPYQVREAWSIGADAILLIAAALERAELAELAGSARGLGLGVLVEIREEAELEAALVAEPDAIGVNARDLRDFSVDPGRAAAMAARIPAGYRRVAESGIKEAAELRALREAGYDAFLVGEALATATDPEARTREFVTVIEATD